jgi:hypothetical protein
LAALTSLAALAFLASFRHGSTRLGSQQQQGHSSSSAETSGSGDSDWGSRFNSSGSAATSGSGDSDQGSSSRGNSRHQR